MGEGKEKKNYFSPRFLHRHICVELRSSESNITNSLHETAIYPLLTSIFTTEIEYYDMNRVKKNDKGANLSRNRVNIPNYNY